MLSDESSSDSETGRFKCQSKPKEEQSSRQKDDFRGRGRPTENDRFRRDFGRQRDERLDFNKHSSERARYSRHSPQSRRKHSRDRSPRRRSPERIRDRDLNARPRHHRSNSKEKRNSISRTHKSPETKSRPQKSFEPRPRAHKSPDQRPRSQRSPEQKTTTLKSPESRPRIQRSPQPRSRRSPEPRPRHKSPESRAKAQQSPEPRRDLKEEIRRTLEPSRKSPSKSRTTRISEERLSLSPEYRGKRSEVHRPVAASSKRKSDSPIIVEDVVESDKSEEVQIGSYYKMIPTVVKEKSEEESSEIDSSDDERLRAKLLNLEKELQKTKKRKHKKKHKRKTKSKDDDATPSVEVTSTTDIDIKDISKDSEVPEVSSTQKIASKESSEEGEISSGDDTQDSQEQYDASDLRYKLRKSKPETPANDVCGPSLPPHLEKKRRSDSPDIEGPALPPHLKKSKNIGPSIPDNMRKVLAEKDCEFIEYESSDDGIGPLPVGAEDKWSDAHQRLEERALDMKIRKLDGHSLESRKIKNREEWMLELPEGKTKYLGLEARSFRAKAGPDMSDRSSWTDTPEEKAKKAAGVVKEEDTDEAIRRDARARLINNRDDEQETIIKKHKKKHKRDESLLEIHEKKIKKKKKKDLKDNDGKSERRPFSRDVDLQVNRFDEAQKKSIIKKAQGLNTRFSRGEAKYL